LPCGPSENQDCVGPTGARTLKTYKFLVLGAHTAWIKVWLTRKSKKGVCSSCIQRRRLRRATTLLSSRIEVAGDDEKERSKRNGACVGNF
jgi:hypothetical protein